MSEEYYEVTSSDLEFYKMYQRWYYCLEGSKYHDAEQDLDVGDLVLSGDGLSIVTGLSGLHRNLSIIRWQRSANRYWCRGIRQSQLKVVNKKDYDNSDEYKKLYAAYIDYLRRNDFQLCTAHFREHWNKHKAGEVTEMEIAYRKWKDSETGNGNNSIFQYVKNIFKTFGRCVAKKKEVIL